MHNKNKLWATIAIFVALSGAMGIVEAVDDANCVIAWTPDDVAAKQGYRLGFLVGYMEGTTAGGCALATLANSYPHADVSDSVAMARAIVDAELESHPKFHERWSGSESIQRLFGPDPLPTDLSEYNFTETQEYVITVYSRPRSLLGMDYWYMPNMTQMEYAESGYAVGKTAGFVMGVLAIMSAVIEDEDWYISIYDPVVTAVEVERLGGYGNQVSMLNELRSESEFVAYFIPEPLSDDPWDRCAGHDVYFSDIEAISEWTGWVPDDGIDEPAIVFDVTLVRDSSWLGGGNAPSSGEMFRILKVKVENRGYDEFEFNPYNCFITVDNVRFSPGYADSSLSRAGYAPPISSGTLLDGGKLEGYMYFEIPYTSSTSFGIGCTIYGGKDYNLFMV